MERITNINVIPYSVIGPMLARGMFHQSHKPRQSRNVVQGDCVLIDSSIRYTQNLDQ